MPFVSCSKSLSSNISRKLHLFHPPPRKTMGRKIDMKKIENTTKCQVTFSKRRSSLMKKANELSICCDIDVAIVAFSPSGRVSRFSSQKKIDEVLQRYVNLPAERRLNQICNVQAKMEKLKQLSHINGDLSKLHYLDKQIENLELQIKKRCLELQILETDLRDYEIAPGQEASLHQLSWCERNLKQSLQRVTARKVQLESQTRNPFGTNFNQNDQVPLITQNPITGQILMQLDPWISPYNAKVRESIFHDLVDQSVEPTNDNIWVSSTANLSNFIPPEQPPMMDQPLLNFRDQNNVDAILKQSMMMDQPFNFQDQNNVTAYSASSSALLSDAMHISTQNLCNIQDPRSLIAKNPNTTLMTPPSYDEMGTTLHYTNSNLMSQFSNIEDNTTLFSKVDNSRNDDMNGQIQEMYQPYNPYNNVLPSKEACEDAHYINLYSEGNIGEDNNGLVWGSNQEKSNLWDWDDLLRDGNFNLPNVPSV